MALVVTDPSRRWPGGCLIWRFSPGLSSAEKNRFRQAMDHWTAKADVRFLERTVQDSFVTFTTDVVDNVNHSSSVGKEGGEQFIYLDPINENDSRTKSSRHEIGHALGFHHEHVRCDRDSFVKVSGHIKLERTGDFFPKKCSSDVIMIGTYDFSSVMHYNTAANATTNGEPALRGSNAANQTLFDNETRREVSNSDAAAAGTLHGGNAHVYQLSSNGQIEKTARQYAWSNGWTTATPFLIDVRNFVFLLKRTDGRMQIYGINADGSIAQAPTDNRDWSSGWTTAIRYVLGATNYLLLYKQGNGEIHIHSINFDGKVGSQISNTHMEPGWTSVEHYSRGFDNFLVLSNASSGEWRVRRVEWDGKIGPSIQAGSWDPGWTTVKPYSVGGNAFLLRRRAGTGSISVRRIEGDGTIGSETDRRNWNSNGLGPAVVVPYEVSGNTYFILLNSTTGI
jgi:hypothetical protein